MRYLSCSALLLALALLGACRRPYPTAPDREAIAQVEKAFHDALGKGDREGAMAFLAPDAEILEMGLRENRSEYAAQHLPADIEFAQAVASVRGPLIIRQDGNVAWTTLTTRSTGTFRGRAVDSENAELMVLAKNGERWQIRAIHWSGHPHRVGD